MKKDNKNRNNLTKTILFRCTEKEYELILKSAESFGSLSSYIRVMLLTNKKIVIAPRVFVSETRQLMADINRVGGNINQIAKYVNYLGKNSFDNEVVESIRSEIRNYADVLDEVRAYLSNLYMNF